MIAVYMGIGEVMESLKNGETVICDLSHVGEGVKEINSGGGKGLYISWREVRVGNWYLKQ